MVDNTGYPVEHPPLFITLEEVQKDNLRVFDFESVPKTFDVNSPHPHFLPFLSSVTYFLAFHTRLVVAQSPDPRARNKPADAVPPQDWDRSAATKTRTLICETPTDTAFKGVFGRYNSMVKIDGPGTHKKPGIVFALSESERLRITQASCEYITAVQNKLFVPNFSATPFSKLILSWEAEWKQEYKSRIAGALNTGNNAKGTFEEFLLYLIERKAMERAFHNSNSNQGAHRVQHPRLRGKRNAKRPKLNINTFAEEEEEEDDDESESDSVVEVGAERRGPAISSKNIEQLLDTVAKQQVLLDGVIERQGTSQLSGDMRVFKLKDLQEEFQKNSEQTVSNDMLTLMSNMALCISTMECMYIAKNPESKTPLALHYDMMINQVERVFKWSVDQKYAFYTALSTIAVFKDARDKLRRP